MLYHTCVTDEEIRDFVASEQQRLGPYFRGVEISWSESENEYRLELRVDSSFMPQFGASVEGWPYGLTLTIAEIGKLEENALSILRSKGRGAYFRLRKEIPGLHRDLALK